MGYTHHWERKGNALDPVRFKQFSADCKNVCLRTEIPLANWNGTGKPVFSATRVIFNGVKRCGHTWRDLGVTWPAPQAVGGVTLGATPVGTWCAGAYIPSRTCDGSCAHETFMITQHEDQVPWRQGEDWLFSFCKTAYKPYDLLVTACLIIYKQYYGEQVHISSDGKSRDWDDARRICQHVLGYGADFTLKA